MAAKQAVWKDPRGLARVAVVGLYVDAICYGISLLGWASIIGATNGALGALTPADATNVNALTSVLALLCFAVFGIVVLMWIYRVCSNAHTLVTGMENSAWGAVLWYFVPIAYLWKPFSSLAETWRVSQSPLAWRKADIPPIMRWWWGLWLGRALFGYVAFQVQRLVPGPGGLVSAAVLGVISDLMIIGAILAFISIVRQLTANQMLAREQNVFD